MNTHFLYVNGIDGVQRQRFSCTCDYCNEDRRTANPSVSFISQDKNGKADHHVLFDIGTGVVDSLVRNPYLKGENACLDLIALTHWHPDHAGELRWLTQGYRWSQRTLFGRDGVPPTWCRATTAAWIRATNPGDHQFILNHCGEEENHPPGTILNRLPIELPDVQITPISVSHWKADFLPGQKETKQYACAVFVIETSTHKALLLWDVDTTNRWLLGEKIRPDTEALIRDADFAFFDCTTWNARERLGRDVTHTPFRMIQNIVDYIRPKNTYLTHLGGHLDGPENFGYGLTPDQWRTAAQKAWTEDGTFGQVDIPYIGLEIGL